MARSKVMKGSNILLLLPLTAVILFCEVMFIKVENFNYSRVNTVFKNPMMGFAPDANYKEAVGDNTLVYVDITWRELEPEEGAFAFEEISTSNYLEHWKKQGKKVVFRFVCDVPDEEKHMDIPDWLYEKTQDGTFYSCAYGQGYSPDYTNKVFIEYHKKAIEALGKEYGRDSFFYFIELGSLGHWGEWHVNYAAGIDPFPEEKVCRQYVEPYLAAFPKAKLLMRRPFSFVEEYGLGVFNDMTGVVEDTEEWLEWIEKGGIYDEAKKPMRLIAYPDIWESSPIGGEFTSSIPMKELLVTKKERTISLLQKSHMTFIGPKSLEAHKEEKKYPKEYAEILKNIGYRYGVKKVTTKHNRIFGTAEIEIQMKNYGVAPMYADWKVCLYTLDEAGEVIRQYETDIDLTKLYQNQTVKTKLKIEDRELLKKGIPSMAIGIENPETKEPEVFLDMDASEIHKKYILF